VNNLLIFYFHLNGFSWPDIGNGGGKNIGPITDQKRAFSTLFFCLYINIPGLFFLLDFTNNNSVTHLHTQMIDTTLIRQWKYIDSFHPLPGSIDKLLFHHSSGCDSTDCNLNILGKNRCRHKSAVFRCWYKKFTPLHFGQFQSAILLFLLGCLRIFKNREDEHRNNDQNIDDQ